MFPPGDDILKVDVAAPPDASDAVELLAAKRTEGDREVVVVMVVNRAVQGPEDRDGPGGPCTVVIDLAPWFDPDAGPPLSSSAMELTIDRTTDLDLGPKQVMVSLQNRWFPIAFSGYGVAFLVLHRATDGG
jgi:hypothetical protein